MAVQAPLQDTVQLAIETTTRRGSIAVFVGENVLRRTNLDPAARTASTLAPELDATLGWCRRTNRDPHFVSIAAGPGSFTGLRIGVTTAKTLSYALDLPLVAVDSLAAIAAASLHAHREIESLCVAIDAYRGQVFTATYARKKLLPPLDAIPADWTPEASPTSVLDGPQWNSELGQRKAGTAVAGDARPFGGLAADRVERPCDAIGVGLLGIRDAARGCFVDPIALVPRYLRLSAAEEKSAGLKR